MVYLAIWSISEELYRIIENIPGIRNKMFPGFSGEIVV